MDPFLADYFGTSQEAPEQVTETDDLEKMAQLVLLDKLAEEQNLDLSQYSQEECLQLADEVFNQNSDTGLTPLEKEAADKFEESVYLGKVVAHSMWNELNSIQKVAYESAGKDVQQAAKSTPLSDAEKSKVRVKKLQNLSEGGLKRELLKVRAKDTAGKLFTGAKKHKGKIGIGAGLLTTGGVAAKVLSGKKNKAADEGQSKEGSAFSQLSDARAYEILQQYGLADDQGNVVAPDQIGYEKTAADQLAESVEVEAWEKLAALGYPVVDQH